MPQPKAGSNLQDNDEEKGENLAEKARRLVASPQGRRAIDLSLEDAMKGAALLKRERRLDVEDLHQPLDPR